MYSSYSYNNILLQQYHGYIHTACMLAMLYLSTSLSCSLLGVDFLDIFSLGKSTLVGTQALLGKFVNTLISTASSSLDHIENSALIGRQSNDLTGNLTAHGKVLGLVLFSKEKRGAWCVGE